ncbi:MAG TPA: hypothetical protein VFM14_09185 [Gemmatimonadales bacterium]|nr:hypothetical protein [Gemmatimonadales bacterium]
MVHDSVPALTPEQWEARDYRQPAQELDGWAKARPGQARDDDSTEYVAKLGLRDDAAVVAMNRAHDRVVVPPPARAALAAFALLDQPFGFSHADVAVLRAAAELQQAETSATALRDLRRRIAALLPPETG